MRETQTRLDFSGTTAQNYAKALRSSIAEAYDELTSAAGDINAVRSVLTRFALEHPELEQLVNISHVVHMDDAHSAIIKAEQALEHVRKALDEHAAGNDDSALQIMGVPRQRKRHSTKKKTTTDPRATVETQSVRKS